MQNEIALQEINGRLMLWEASIRQTENLLALENRTRLAIENGDPQKRDFEYFKLFKEFSIAQPEYVEGQINSAHINLFNETCNPPFPITSDLFSIYDSLVEMAIIYFCQILNPGNAQQNIAMKNDKKFIDENIASIAESIFVTPKEIEKFTSFCVSIKEARDKMLAHTDAKSFDIQHGDNVSSMSMHRVSWANINFEYWKSFLDKFRISILEKVNSNAL